MASVREGHRPVLLVVDVQVGVMANAWDADRVVGNIVHTVERARSAGVPVVWVQHSNDELPRDSAAWQWVPALVPAAGEARVHKRYNSAFEDTELDAVLERLATTHAVLAGAESSWCIRATAYAALERGYDLTLVRDAHTTGAITLDNGSTTDPARVVDELNVTLNWMEYRGRRTRSIASADLDFAAAPG